MMVCLHLRRRQEQPTGGGSNGGGGCVWGPTEKMRKLPCRSRSPASVSGTPTKSTLLHVTRQERGRCLPACDRHLNREPAVRIVMHGWFVLTPAGISVTALRGQKQNKTPVGKKEPHT